MGKRACSGTTCTGEGGASTKRGSGPVPGLGQPEREVLACAVRRNSGIAGNLGGDPVLLEQVLVNLVINAMDAMEATPPDQRHVTISSEARRTRSRGRRARHRAGLPADLMGRLFTPFVTTKSHGVGIGLAIARTIVEAHGGSIGARNSPEGGAIFTVTLPARDGHEVQPVCPQLSKP